MTGTNKRSVELGSGLIAIGREWGTTPQVPSEYQAQEFLEAAYNSGIRYFDTAPAYGLSEERLGRFLDSLAPEQRQDVTVATKMGEYWKPDSQDTYVDHSYDALMESFARSRFLLGKIALLQIHKSTQEVIRSEDIERALKTIREDAPGIQFGASVSDEKTAVDVLNDNRFDAIQMPFNKANPVMREAILAAGSLHKAVLINRPLQMGSAVRAAKSEEDRHSAMVESYEFILQAVSKGVILSGTSNPRHLRQNVAAFSEARERTRTT